MAEGGEPPAAAAAPVAMAVDEPPAPRAPKRMRLVLDDGTIIKGEEGAGAAQRLPAAVAHEAGLLTEAHLLKAQVLLLEEHAKLPEEGPLRTVSGGSKRSSSTAFEVRCGAPGAGPPRSTHRLHDLACAAGGLGLRARSQSERCPDALAPPHPPPAGHRLGQEVPGGRAGAQRRAR